MKTKVEDMLSEEYAAQRRALEAAGTATGRQTAATEPASAAERSIADGRKTIDSPLLSVA